jgi:hypothetical protein
MGEPAYAKALAGKEKNKVCLNKGEQKHSICIYNPVFLNLHKQISLLIWKDIQNGAALNFAKTSKITRQSAKHEDIVLKKSNKLSNLHPEPWGSLVTGQ